MSAGISAAAWLGAGAAVVGGTIASRGARSAASTAAGAQEQATQAQLGQYEQTREDYLPWMEAGRRGLERYEAEAGIPTQIAPPTPFSYTGQDMYADPGYQFRVGEGERGLNRALASQGKLGSGNRLRALMELNQQMGSQEFAAGRGRALQDYGLNVVDPYNRQYGAEQDYFNRLASLSNIGQSATGGVTAATPNIAPYIAGAGESRAAGQIGSTGAWSSAIGDIARQFNRPQQPRLDTWSQYGVSPAEYAEYY